MLIRAERPEDIPAIEALTRRAFGGPEEARLVAQLRADGDAVISLVATEAGAVLGHVMLSPMQAPLRALGLAPLSVEPRRQRHGIGAALVEAASARARKAGWEGIFVLGDPAYYGRFGFQPDLAARYSCRYAGPFLALLPLVDPVPALTGSVNYAPAFAALD